MRPLLLLPAPMDHKCLRCGITSHYRALGGDDQDRGGLYFVEHVIDGGPDLVLWELCDLCEQDWREAYYRRTPHISVWRGQTPWSEHCGYAGFENTPLICVTDASNADWDEERHCERETWLFCRNRAEWRAAWQIARILAREGAWPERYLPLLSFLPAVKPAGSQMLCISVRPLENRLIGQCDWCGADSANLIVRPGEQWANCPACAAERESLDAIYARKEAHV